MGWGGVGKKERESEEVAREEKRRQEERAHASVYVVCKPQRELTHCRHT